MTRWNHNTIRNRLHEDLSTALVRDTYDSPAPYSGHPDASVEREHSLDGGRPDVAVSLPEADFAFEVKTSYTDYRRYPAQASAYRRSGYQSVLVATPTVYHDLGEDGRIPTGWCVRYNSDGFAFVAAAADELPVLEDRWGVVDPKTVDYQLSAENLDLPA